MRTLTVHSVRPVDGRLVALREQVREVEERGSGSRDRGTVAVPSVASEGPRLAIGVVHEWFSGSGAEGAPGRWLSPLCVLASLAALSLNGEGNVAWIGRRCWPTVSLLAQAAKGRALLRCSVLVDPPDEGARLWAIDMALRCPGVAAVVADGSGCSMAASRRLQLAAGQGRALALIARPVRELRSLSAAGGRWLARPEPSRSGHPRWTVELLRCKGLQPTHGAPRRWAVEWDHAQGLVALPAPLAAGPLPAAAAGSRLACTA